MSRAAYQERASGKSQQTPIIGWNCPASCIASSIVQICSSGLRSFFVPEKPHRIGRRTENPAFQIRYSWAHFDSFSAFLASRKMNKLHVFNSSEYSTPASMILVYIILIISYHKVLASARRRYEFFIPPMQSTILQFSGLAPIFRSALLQLALPSSIP